MNENGFPGGPGQRQTPTDNGANGASPMGPEAQMNNSGQMPNGTPVGNGQTGMEQSSTPVQQMPVAQSGLTGQPMMGYPQAPMMPQMPGVQPLAPAGRQKSNSGKLKLIGGIAVAVIAVIVLAIVVMASLGGNGTKKTLACSTYISEAWGGVGTTMTYAFKIGDGAINQLDLKIKYELDGNAQDYFDGSTEEDWIAEKIAEDKKSCDGDCTFTYDYVKGKSLEETLSYNQKAATDYIGSGVENYSAEEISEKIQEGMAEETLVWKCKED